jgi:RNA polymerase sigma-70 factor (ECF subfamily)
MQATNGFPSMSSAHRKAAIKAPSDDELIEAIAAGNRRAMELLFVRHNVRIHRFISRITGNVSLAEDTVSEVFLEVWRGAGTFKRKSNVSTWLLAIARYKAMSALRRRQMDGHLCDDAAAALVDGADDPETVAHRISRGAVIRKCLMQLPPTLREVVDLVYYHEKSVTEVAQIVGVPPGTVKTRMFHARSRMSALLEGAGIRGVGAN